VINDREILHGHREQADHVTYINNGRSLNAVITDLKNEGRSFINTRLAMLKAEMNEKMSHIKSALPMLAIGLVFALTAWAVLTGCLICVIAAAFGPGILSWVWATLIVGVAYLLIGGAAGFFAFSEIKRASLTPERTLRVLKQDQEWIQRESSTTVTDVKEDVKHELRKVA
jgi:uncharacterized membrane protein YqjE